MFNTSTKPSKQQTKTYERSKLSSIREPYTKISLLQVTHVSVVTIKAQELTRIRMTLSVALFLALVLVALMLWFVT